MLNVAMLSKWHVHAGGYANALQKMEDVKITCLWDEQEERGQAWASELGVAFEKDLDTLLARSDVDAVIIDTATGKHEEVMIKAAKAKKHIFTEKAMALTTAACDNIIAAVKEAGVKFCISYPFRTRPPYLFAKKAIEDGVIGDVVYMRMHNGHDGALAGWLPEYWYDEEDAGGGAMMDLGCHPMYAASGLMGKPVRINSTFTYVTGRKVEDNSSSTIEFANGAIAVCETSLVQPFGMEMFEIYGTKGGIVSVNGNLQINSTAVSSPYKGWTTPELPKALPEPIRIFVEGVLYDSPIPFGLCEGRALTELLEGAYIAHREKKDYCFCNCTGC